MDKMTKPAGQNPGGIATIMSPEGAFKLSPEFTGLLRVYRISGWQCDPETATTKSKSFAVGLEVLNCNG